MNKGRYLYLLDLDDEHIKYGIGTDFGRIQQHLRTYPGINLDNSYIVNASRSKTITLLEQEIKHIFGMDKKKLPEHFHGKDGYTEITKKEKLQDILEYIVMKQKYDVLGITYKAGIESVIKESKPKKLHRTKLPRKIFELNLNVDLIRGINEIIAILESDDIGYVKNDPLELGSGGYFYGNKKKLDRLSEIGSGSIDLGDKTYATIFGSQMFNRRLGCNILKFNEYWFKSDALALFDKKIQVHQYRDSGLSWYFEELKNCIKSIVSVLEKKLEKSSV